MNFGSSSTGSSTNPPPGTYYNYNPYSPVYQSSTTTNFGYSPSSWPPPDASEDPKKDPTYVYNGYGGESDPVGHHPPPPFRPPSEEDLGKNGSENRGDDESKNNDLIVPSSVNSTGHEGDNSSSSPLGSNEDSSSSNNNNNGGVGKGCTGMDEDKKASSLEFRPHESELLSDLSKFDDKQQQELLSNNNNDEYHHLGTSELDKGPALAYDHNPPTLNHDEWLAANQQHLQGGGMQQHGFPMGMGPYGQQQQQPPQQPMWNYYNSYPSGGHHAPPPHQDRFMDSPWWNYGPPPQQPQQQPPASHPPAGLQPPGSWALRGPRPSPRGGGGERRGPGRPRLSASNKVPGSPGGDSSSSASSPSSRPRIPVSPLNSGFPSPYSSSELSPGEDTSDRKRGPGRPRIGLVDGLDGSPGMGGNLLEELSGPIHHAPQPPVNHSNSSAGNNNSSSSSGGGGKSKGSSNSASSNKKRYVCEICQKRFSTAWYVRVHRKSHNGERPYICHNCGKGFMLPNVLQVHLRKCEKTTNLRPEGINSPQVRPTNVSPGSAAGLPPSSTPNNNNNHIHGQDSGSPLPQHNVPYPGDIYGGLYNQRFQPPDSMGYSMHHGDQQQQQQQNPAAAAAAHLHASSMNNYVNESNLPGGFPNDRSPYGSPLFSPSHHFLANDRPPDKGGGGGPQGQPSNPNTPYPLTCQSCDSIFETPSGLEDHYPCPRSSGFSCSFCDKTFSDKGEFDSHLMTSHGICPVCSERFPFKSSLLSHIKSLHEKFTLENHQIISEASAGVASSNTGLKADANLLSLESEESEGAPHPPPPPPPPASSGTGDLSTKLTQQTPLAMS